MQTIKNKYAAAGYPMPQMIFWNVRATANKDFPVQENEQGVALVSGFSPSLLKDIMESGEFTTPEELLQRILANPRYSVLAL